MHQEIKHQDADAEEINLLLSDHKSNKRSSVMCLFGIIIINNIFCTLSCFT